MKSTVPVDTVLSKPICSVSISEEEESGRKKLGMTLSGLEETEDGEESGAFAGLPEPSPQAEKEKAAKHTMRLVLTAENKLLPIHFDFFMIQIPFLAIK